MNLEEIKKQAESEVKNEEFRKAVDVYKKKMRAKKWWHKLVPFKIVILKRD
tara:strand:+ start:625 stop:777 length:153 start_codon:yes stop_codon:yes gene_type:complete